MQVQDGHSSSPTEAGFSDLEGDEWKTHRGGGHPWIGAPTASHPSTFVVEYFFGMYLPHILRNTVLNFNLPSEELRMWKHFCKFGLENEI